MKHNILKRILSLVLTLMMLIPGYLPQASADSGVPFDPAEIFNWRSETRVINEDFVNRTMNLQDSDPNQFAEIIDSLSDTEYEEFYRILNGGDDVPEPDPKPQLRAPSLRGVSTDPIISIEWEQSTADYLSNTVSGSSLIADNATGGKKLYAKYAIGYAQAEVPEGGYARNSLTIVVPGFGNINREGIVRATSIAADEASSAVKSHDWSYTWDESNDIYTFTNNRSIEEGSNLSGFFEICYSLNAENTVNGFTQDGINATLFTPDGNSYVSADTLQITSTTHQDTFVEDISGPDTTSIYTSDIPAEYQTGYYWMKYVNRLRHSDVTRNEISYRVILDPDSTNQGSGVVVPDKNTASEEAELVNAGYGSDWVVLHSDGYNDIGQHIFFVGYPLDQYANKTVTQEFRVVAEYMDGDDNGVYGYATAYTQELEIQIPGVANSLLVPDSQIFRCDHNTNYPEPNNYNYYGYPHVSAGDVKSGSVQALNPRITIANPGEYTYEVTMKMDSFFALTEGGSFARLSADDYNLTGLTLNTDIPGAAMKIYAAAGGAESLVYDGAAAAGEGVVFGGGVTAYRVVLTGQFEEGGIFFNGGVNYHLRDNGVYEFSDGHIFASSSVSSRIDNSGSWEDLPGIVHIDNYAGFACAPYNVADEDAALSATDGGGLSRSAYRWFVYDKLPAAITPSASGSKAAIPGTSVSGSASRFVSMDFKTTFTLNDYDNVLDFATEAVLPPEISLYNPSSSDILSLVRIDSNFPFSESELIDRCTVSESTNEYGGTSYRFAFDFSGDDYSLAGVEQPYVSVNLTGIIDADYYKEEISSDIYTFSYPESRPHAVNLMGGRTYLSNKGVIEWPAANNAELSVREGVYVPVQTDSMGWDASATYPGEDYSYILAVSSGSNRMRDLVVFDIIENELEPEWRGTFGSVSTASVAELGYSPVVYYTDNVNAAFDLSSGDWTTDRGSLGTVRGVAFDFGSQEIAMNQTLTLNVNMTAPNGTEHVGEYTYDGFTASATLIDRMTGDERASGDMDSNIVTLGLTERDVPYTVPKSTLTLYKTDLHTGEALANITFSLKGSGDEADVTYTTDGFASNNAEYNTDENGNITWYVRPGTYVLSEVAGERGYGPAFGDGNTEVVIGNEIDDYEIHVQNIQKFSTYFIKRDAQTGNYVYPVAKEGEPLVSTAVFDIYRIEDNDELSYICTINSAEHTPALDAYYTYLVRETTAPSGYQAAEWTMSAVYNPDSSYGLFDIVLTRSDGYAEDATEFEANFHDDEKTASVQITKYIEYNNDHSTAVPAAGVSFQVFTSVYRYGYVVGGVAYDFTAPGPLPEAALTAWQGFVDNGTWDSYYYTEDRNVIGTLTTDANGVTPVLDGLLVTWHSQSYQRADEPVWDEEGQRWYYPMVFVVNDITRPYKIAELSAPEGYTAIAEQTIVLDEYDHIYSYTFYNEQIAASVDVKFYEYDEANDAADLTKPVTGGTYDLLAKLGSETSFSTLSEDNANGADNRVDGVRFGEYTASNIAGLEHDYTLVRIEPDSVDGANPNGEVIVLLRRNVPEISVEKTIVSQSVNAEGYGVGEIIEYQITVENSGNVTLSNVTVEDLLDGIEFQNSEDYVVSNDNTLSFSESLAPGESVVVTAFYEVTGADADAGSILNTVEASAEDPNGDPVSGQDTAEADTWIPPFTQLVVDALVPNDIHFAHGNPVFIAEVTGTDTDGNDIHLYHAFEFTAEFAEAAGATDMLIQSKTFEVPAGTYNARVHDAVRYSQSESEIPDGPGEILSDAKGEYGSFDLSVAVNGILPTGHFAATFEKYEWQMFSDAVVLAG